MRRLPRNEVKYNHNGAGLLLGWNDGQECA